MKKNMGTFDRVLRTLIAGVLAWLWYAGILTGPIGIVLLVIAGIFLLTSIAGYCPLYVVLGIRTCKSQTGRNLPHRE